MAPVEQQGRVAGCLVQLTRHIVLAQMGQHARGPLMQEGRAPFRERAGRVAPRPWWKRKITGEEAVVSVFRKSAALWKVRRKWSKRVSVS